MDLFVFNISLNFICILGGILVLWSLYFTTTCAISAYHH